MTNQFRLTCLATLCMTMAAARISTAAGDWPQWRGPKRDGVLEGFRAPKHWPKQLKRGWRVKVGVGHASPLVAGGRVYQFARQGDDEVALCLKLATGEPIWRRSYRAPYEINSAAVRHGKGPKSTPLVTEGKLFTFGISGILTCYDATDGKKRWQKAFGKQFPKTSPLYGVATSPIVDAGKVIVHVGGHDHGALIACDVETGHVRWSWDGDGPAYTSPIIVTLHGVRQIVTESQNNRLGIDVDSGKVLWKIPFTTAWDQNIVTPIVSDDTIIFSGLNKGITAFRVNHRDGQWSTEQAWHNADVSMYMSSPVRIGQRIIGLSHQRKGQFFGLDAKNGNVDWTSDGRQGDNALLVATDKVILALTTNGELIVIDSAETSYRQLARYRVADTATWSHPALVGRQILIKDTENLTLWTIPDNR